MAGEYCLDPSRIDWNCGGSDGFALYFVLDPVNVRRYSDILLFMLTNLIPPLVHYSHQYLTRPLVYPDLIMPQSFTIILE